MAVKQLKKKTPNSFRVIVCGTVYIPRNKARRFHAAVIRDTHRQMQYKEWSVSRTLTLRKEINGTGIAVPGIQ